MPEEHVLIKRRIEALVAQANANATSHGGDVSTAAMDLLMALTLLTKECGGDIDAVLPATLKHAKAAVSAFWPDEAVH